jgi:uncharacterized protein (DUF433 family)
MQKEYIEKREGGYWITGTRISLDSIVYAFQRGAAPETIKRNFPTLTLEEIFGAITFYLANEKEIDDYLQQSEIEFAAQADQRREQLRKEKPDLMNRLEELKRREVVR